MKLGAIGIKIVRLFKQYILHIVFATCLIFSIRWSNIPVIDNYICRKIFVPTREVDSSMLGVVTGYISGYFVYISTVLMPKLISNSSVKKWLWIN